MAEKKVVKKERMSVDVVTSIGEKDVTVEMRIDGKTIEINVTNDLEFNVKTKL